MKNPVNPLAVIAEGKLYDHLMRIGRFREKRIGVHIHMSCLLPENRREHNLRIAAHTFDNIIGQNEGEMFLLGNGDIIFIADGVPQLQIERSLERLRSLFSEDPLIYASSENNPFCTWYYLEKDYDRLLNFAKILVERAAAAPVDQYPIPRPPLTARALAAMEDVLHKADITNFVRNQTVCVHARSMIKPVFDELYVSMQDLQRSLMPTHNLRSSLWLFQYVTEILDKRMFVYLANLPQKPDRLFSINLNISSVLSPEFQVYDETLTAAERGGNMVIEIQKHDIFADMGAYRFAQEYLHDRTHKLCLDGITHLTLPFIDREQLKLDLVKLCWSPELREKKDRLLKPLRDHIDTIGPQRLIMVHCDTPDALEIGAELGISMYQGRYVTNLLQRARKPPVPAAAN